MTNPQWTSSLVAQSILFFLHFLYSFRGLSRPSALIRIDCETMKPFKCLVEPLPRITIPLSTNGNTIDKRGLSSSLERDSKPRFRCLRSPTPHAPRTDQLCGQPSAVHVTTIPFIVQLSTYHNSPQFKICIGYTCGGISIFNNFNLKLC
jgi:hypothetical protein